MKLVILRYSKDSSPYPVCHSKLINTIVQIIEKAAEGVSLEERLRMHTLAHALVACGQGIAFFHAGCDILRSKSLDRDSYNSGQPIACDIQYRLLHTSDLLFCKARGSHCSSRAVCLLEGHERCFEAVLAEHLLILRACWSRSYTLHGSLRYGHLATSLTTLISFFAGSKCIRPSFCTGDWFNRLDWTKQSNNFAVGLPVGTKNAENWDSKQPLLANPKLKPSPDQIQAGAARVRELVSIRYSSPLFRLRSREEVQKQLTFLNSGLEQVLTRGSKFLL